MQIPQHWKAQKDYSSIMLKVLQDEKLQNYVAHNVFPKTEKQAIEKKLNRRKFDRKNLISLKFKQKKPKVKLTEPSMEATHSSKLQTEACDNKESLLITASNFESSSKFIKFKLPSIIAKSRQILEKTEDEMEQQV